MTTLIYCPSEGILLADGRETGTSGQIYSDNEEKIVLVDGGYLALGGDSHGIDKVLELFPNIEAGLLAEDELVRGYYVAFNGADTVVSELCADADGIQYAIVKNNSAVGSGEQFALGALSVGATAIDAMAAAMLNDSHTGGVVLCLDLRGASLGHYYHQPYVQPRLRTDVAEKAA